MNSTARSSQSIARPALPEAAIHKWNAPSSSSSSSSTSSSSTSKNDVSSERSHENKIQSFDHVLPKYFDLRMTNFEKRAMKSYCNIQEANRDPKTISLDEIDSSKHGLRGWSQYNKSGFQDSTKKKNSDNNKSGMHGQFKKTFLFSSYFYQLFFLFLLPPPSSLFPLFSLLSLLLQLCNW